MSRCRNLKIARSEMPDARAALCTPLAEEGGAVALFAERELLPRCAITVRRGLLPMGLKMTAVYTRRLDA